MEEKRGFGQA